MVDDHLSRADDREGVRCITDEVSIASPRLARHLRRVSVAGPEPHVADDDVVRVADLADAATLAELGIEDPFDLSGLYSGRPVSETAQTGDLPTTIHLFRRPILDEWAESGETLEHLVAHVLVHEVGHHFGLTDDQMHKLENIVA